MATSEYGSEGAEGRTASFETVRQPATGPRRTRKRRTGPSSAPASSSPRFAPPRRDNRGSRYRLAASTIGAAVGSEM